MHILVVGGSGMLGDACLHFAAAGAVVSVIGRTESKLKALAERVPNRERINPLALDYRDGRQLQQHLRRAAIDHGSFKLAICWIHRTAPEAPMQVAKVLSEGLGDWHYFDIHGSSTESSAARERERRLRQLAGPAYRKIALGCRLTPDGWRWLTHDEISRGVVAAVESDAEIVLVGDPVPQHLE